mmetsp:Transcript_20657/g.45301  ORF Transcript_20657/g.45301 Transcript_20657/m.45301 type:complete len:286 (-) Transcript_20657:306-1163(-)
MEGRLLETVRRLHHFALLVFVLPKGEAKEVLHRHWGLLAVETKLEPTCSFAFKRNVEVDAIGDFGDRAVLHQQGVPRLGLDALLLDHRLQDGVMPPSHHTWPGDREHADLHPSHLLDGPEGLIPLDRIQQLTVDYESLLHAAILCLVAVSQLQIRTPAPLHGVFPQSVDDVVLVNVVFQWNHNIDSSLVLGHFPKVQVIGVLRPTRWSWRVQILHLLAAFKYDARRFGLRIDLVRYRVHKTDGLVLKVDGRIRILCRKGQPSPSRSISGSCPTGKRHSSNAHGAS